MKKGRLIVVFASVGCFLLVPVLLLAQLAVSSEDSAAQPNNFPSNKDGWSGARQDEKDFLREERPEVSVLQGKRRSGGESPTTAEETWHYSLTKRQRRGSSRSSIHWHLPRKSSRTRSYRSMSSLLAVVTSMTAAIFLLWRLGNAVLRCLEQNRNTPRSAGTTPRLLGISDPPSFAACVEVAKKSLSSGDSGEDEVVDMAVGNPPGEDVVDMDEGNPPGEHDVEAAIPIKATGGDESGGISAQNKRRHKLSRVLRFGFTFMVGAAIIFAISLQVWSMVGEGAGGVAQIGKDVLTIALVLSGVLTACGDFFAAGRETRGNTSVGSTLTRSMQKRIANFFFLFTVPVLTIVALHKDTIGGPLPLVVVAIVVLVYLNRNPFRRRRQNSTL